VEFSYTEFMTPCLAVGLPNCPSFLKFWKPWISYRSPSVLMTLSFVATQVLR